MKLTDLWERVGDVSATASTHEETLQLCVTLPVSEKQRADLQARGVTASPTTYQGLTAVLQLAELVSTLWPELLDDSDNASLYSEVFEQAACLAGRNSQTAPLPATQLPARHLGYVLVDPDGAPNVYCEVLLDAMHGPALIVRASPSLTFDVQLTEASARRLAELLIKASTVPLNGLV